MNAYQGPIMCDHCGWTGDECELLHEVDARDPDITIDECPRCFLADALSTRDGQPYTPTTIEIDTPNV